MQQTDTAFHLKVDVVVVRNRPLQLLVGPKFDSLVQCMSLIRRVGNGDGLDTVGGWGFWRGAGEVVKIWVGLKKVGDIQGRFPEVNGGECSWEKRAEEEVIGGLLILATVGTYWGRGFVNFKLEGLKSGAE